VLLDECVPHSISRELPSWTIHTVRGIGWESKLDGELLRAANAEYDVLITVDRRLVFQQNLTGLRLAIIVLVAYRNSLRFLQPLLPELAQVLDAIQPGEVVFIPR
jgi:hypothetical protein